MPDVSDALTISVTDIRVDHAGQLQTSGQLGISDADAGESHFNAQQEVAGTYGSFSIDASGHWVYSVDNGQVGGAEPAGRRPTDRQLPGGPVPMAPAMWFRWRSTARTTPRCCSRKTQSVSETAPCSSGQMQASDADAGDTLSFHIDQPVAGLHPERHGSYSFGPVQRGLPAPGRRPGPRR
ncbi:hypothetical protein HT094_01105 [Shewanella sp. ZOR0012]|nr:hypothetical protein [Shewanella sp. ZOR0012]